MYRVTLIPGDGIGPEVVEAAKRCVDATGVEIEWQEFLAGQRALEEYGKLVPDELLDSIRENKVALKGPITTPVGSGFRSINVFLRKELDLFACVRPAKIYPGVNTRYDVVDLVVVRENTEDLYAGIEFQEGKEETEALIDLVERYNRGIVRPDAGVSLKAISRFGSERIVRFAFEYALQNGRKKVTAVHKANILKFSDGLFLDVARQVAKDYEGKIEFEDIIVDNLCMQLVQRPEKFDVLVLPNLYGDIVSDLCAGLIGGLGVAPGANIGRDIALFEPVHGSAPKYAGLNRVNPMATILSAVMMLDYLGEHTAARRLEGAVEEVLRERKSVTYDLLPPSEQDKAVGTMEMAEAICQKLR